MSAIVIEHVKVSELPEDWRARLQAAGDAHVTVRIEVEATAHETAAGRAENPMFGMWSAREDMADVEANVRKLRAPRF